MRTDIEHLVTKEFLRMELRLLERRLTTHLDYRFLSRSSARLDAPGQTADDYLLRFDRQAELFERRMTVRLGLMVAVGFGTTAALVQLL